jgi:class 3 adenylate cyclase/tetratricopeptide (TPR) repeat protein
MTCPACRHPLPSDAGFCPECGVQVLRCAQCGAVNAPTHKFCKKCGDALRNGAGSVESRSLLEGERKQVTVLFADLKDSMELLADRDPEDARAMLDAVLGLMIDAVHRYEGTVNQVMGDGIMALFGAPIAHEDHAVSACYAALKMQEMVKGFAATRTSAGPPVAIRVGLNSGEVVVGSIGRDLRMDYTAVGQTTHLAARMEQTATPGTIRATASTMRLAGDFVTGIPLGPLHVKGLHEPIDAYEIVGVTAAASRLHAAAARGLTPFVGRDSELRHLRDAAGLSRAGHGQIVTVVGDPGVGKSRLCWEFVRTSEADGWRTLHAGGVSYGRTTPYWPIRRLLQAYFGVEDRPPSPALTPAIRQRLAALDPALEASLPAVLSLMDLPQETAAWDALDPLHRRERTMETVCQILTRESGVMPLLIVLEDLQWIDGETQAILDRLVDTLAAARLLLLVNFRPEYTHGWMQKSCFQHIRIDTLREDGARALLDQLLGPHASLSALKARLIERTGGNPFFLEELVRSLVETGSLAGDVGAYRLQAPINDLAIAPSVQAVLAARIDRLPPPQKRLLQAAAVIGKDVPLAWLHALSDQPQDVHRHLAELCAADFMHGVRAQAGDQFTFRHALTHEVAYGGILSERRRALHGRLVDIIETLHGGQLLEYSDTLAHHALSAQRWDKAIDHLRASGARAYAAGAAADCLARYEQALGLVDKLGATLDDRRRIVDLYLDFHGPLFLLGQFERLTELSQEAQRWAEVIGDRHRAGRASACLAACAGARADYDAAISHGDRALAIANEVDAPELRIAASHLLGVCHEARGDYPTAMRFLSSVVDGPHVQLARQRLGLVLPPYIFDNGWMGICHGFTGDFERATAYSVRAVRTADELDHPGGQTFAYALHASVLGLQGQLSEAAEWARRGVQLGEAHAVFAFIAAAQSAYGWVQAWMGRSADGLDYLERAITLQETLGLKMHVALFYCRLAEGALLASDVEGAHDAASKAHELSGALGERGSQADAVRLLGEIALRRGDLDEAAGFYGRALNLATTLGMRPLAAHTCAGLARLSARRGDRSAARRHLQEALAMYGAMRMTFWPDVATSSIEPAS